MHRAPCILQALRLRQRVHHNIATGRHRRHEVTPPWPAGVATADLCLHAALDGSKDPCELVVRDLRSGEICSRWPLDSSAMRIFHELGGARWTTGSLLAIAYCGALPTEPVREDAGVLLIDVLTGACTKVRLAAGELHMPWHPSLSTWSCQGVLLVCRPHLSRTGFTYSAVDVRGSVSSTASLPATVATSAQWPPQAHWAPDGCTALLHCGPAACLWDLRSGEQPAPLQLTGDVGPACFALCPDACCRVLLFAWFRPHSIVAWTSPSGEQLLPIPDRLRRGHAVLWGSHNRVAICCDTLLSDTLWAPVRRRLSFFRVTGSNSLRLDLVRTQQSPDQSCAHLSFGQQSLSPDGAFVCASGIFGQPRALSTKQNTSLDLFSMDGHVGTHLALPFEEGTTAWSADSSRLLVTDKRGFSHLLVDFA